MFKPLLALAALAALWALPTEQAIAQKRRPAVPANKAVPPTKAPTGDPDVRVEIFNSAERFAERLGGALRTVDFDDIETDDQPTPFAADRYKKKLGVVITGQDGQFVGRTFQYPRNYVPRSKPNMYAPGPKGRPNGSAGEGGKQTAVTFFDGERSSAVSGFGAHFIDVNYPGIGKSALVVYDARGRELAREEGFSGGTGKAAFRGAVAVDRTGRPVPVIARVTLVNGSGWPEVYNNEGVTLDDFLFPAPGQAGPARGVVNKDGGTSPDVANDRGGPTPNPMQDKGRPETLQDVLNRAHAARVAGRLDEAVRLYGQVLRADPKVLDAYLGRGDIYRRQYRTNESLADFSRVIELAPGDPRGHASRGNTYAGAGQLDEALKDLDRAIALNPDYAFAYRMRAEVFVRAGKPDQALANIGTAIRIEPERSDHYFMRGVIRFDQGDLKGAWGDALAAVRVNPDDALGHYLKAMICSLEERYDRALAAMGRAVQLDPRNPGLHAERAAVLARLGRGEEALRAARSASEANPRFPGNHRGLGMAYWALGKYAEAESAFGQAIAADATAADNYEVRALCYIALRQLGKAETDIRKVLELTPQHPRAHDAAARYYRAANDPRAKDHEARAKELRQKMVRVTGD